MYIWVIVVYRVRLFYDSTLLGSRVYKVILGTLMVK